MAEIDDLKFGWDFMAQMLGADFAGRSAFSDHAANVAQNSAIQAQNLRIQEINAAIDQLAKNINEHPSINLNVEQFKGFVAEEMHAGTFNIDAIRQGSSHRAWTLQENGYGSVDVQTNFGKEYSLKYSNTAKDAENIDKIDSIKKSMLAKAFRGELGTNIADEESSIELLKSIIEA